MSGLVLASASLARAAVLEKAGIAFSVAESGVDEAPIKSRALDKGLSALAIAELLAEAKAIGVSARCSATVLGADQTLEMDGVLFDKVSGRDEAKARLMLMRGRSHRLNSAIAAAERGEVVWRTVESATLVMRAFSEEFVEHYLDACGEAVLRSSGCYFLEGRGAQLFEEVDGDFFTILGLPLLPVLSFLRSAGLAGE